MALRLNLGCGYELSKHYINIDMHSKEEIMKRYGIEKDIYPDIHIESHDILDLPYRDNSIDEMLCEGFLEHLSFVDEGRFFKQAQKLLKSGGVLNFTVPDFDSACRQWLEAEDDFVDFYKLTSDEHWFGNYSRTIKNKWGYLTATFFGNQNGEGQFHRNCYTAKKIMSIMNMLGFDYQLHFFNFKETEIKMIRCIATKR